MPSLQALKRHHIPVVIDHELKRLQTRKKTPANKTLIRGMCLWHPKAQKISSFLPGALNPFSTSAYKTSLLRTNKSTITAFLYLSSSYSGGYK